MNLFKIILAACLLACSLAPASISAQEMTLSEKIAARMIAIAKDELGDPDPVAMQSPNDIRLYAKKNGRIFLISLTLNAQKKGCEIEVSELIRPFRASEWNELKKREFFDFPSQMVAKRLFIEKGTISGNEVTFKRQ